MFGEEYQSSAKCRETHELSVCKRKHVRVFLPGSIAEFGELVDLRLQCMQWRFVTE